MGHRDLPPLTEPVIVPCLFCTGAQFEIHEGFVRIVGWVALPYFEGAPERRIVSRMVMPCDPARALSRDMHRELRRGGH